MNHVQTQKVDSSGTSVNFPAITVTAGNLMTVKVRLGGNVTVTISDGGNTWTQIPGASKNPDADGDSVQVYYAKNVTGGSRTVNVAPSSSVSVRGHVSEWSGADTSSPADQSNLTDTQIGTTANSGSITTSAAGMLVLFCATGMTQGTWTAGTLGSATATIPTNGTTGKTAIEYHNEASGASRSGAISFDVSETVAFASIFNFKDSAGGGPTPAVKDMIGGGIIPYARV